MARLIRSRSMEFSCRYYRPENITTRVDPDREEPRSTRLLGSGARARPSGAARRRVLPCARVDARRLRALFLIVAGWLVPTAASCAFVLHDLEHAHRPGARADLATILHGHTHDESEPQHDHDLAGAAFSGRLAFRPDPVFLPSTGLAQPVAPLIAPARTTFRRDDPDPGGPARQASLRVFRI